MAWRGFGARYGRWYSAGVLRFIRRRRTLEEQVIRKNRLKRVRRNWNLPPGAGPSIPTGLMVPPFIITGVQGPFEVPGPLQVYTSSTYFEAPTVVNTMDAWNVLRTTVENFPLWWNRIR